MLKFLRVGIFFVKEGAVSSLLEHIWAWFWECNMQHGHKKNGNPFFFEAFFRDSYPFESAFEGGFLSFVEAFF